MVVVYEVINMKKSRKWWQVQACCYLYFSQVHYLSSNLHYKSYASLHFEHYQTPWIQPKTHPN